MIKINKMNREIKVTRRNQKNLNKKKKNYNRSWNK